MIILVLLCACASAPEPQPTEAPAALPATALAAPTLAALPATAQPAPTAPAIDITATASTNDPAPVIALPTITPIFPERRLSEASLSQLEPLRSVGFGGARAAAIAPGNQLLAVATTAGVALFELPSLRHLRFDPIAGGAHDLAFAADGQTLAITSGDAEPHERQVRRVSDGVVLAEAPATMAPFSLQVRSPDEQILATFNQPDSSPAPGIKLSRADIAQPLYEDSNTTSVAFSPDSSLIALVAYDGTLRLLDSHGALLDTLELPAYWSVGFSPDGQTMVTAGQSVMLWDVVTSTLRQRLSNLALAGDSWVTGAQQRVRFSPDGTLLTVEGSYSGFEAAARRGSTWAIGADGIAHVWDSDAGGAGVINFATYIGAISPATKAVAQTNDGVALHIDSANGQRVSVPVPRGISALAFSPDGRLLAVADKAGHVRLLQADTGTSLRTIEAGGMLLTLGFSADSALLGGYRDDGTIQSWAVSDGTMIGRVATAPAAAAPIRQPSELIFTPDNALLIALGDRSVGFYRVADGALVYQLLVSAAAVAIGPRQRLLGLVRDGRVELWGLR